MTETLTRPQITYIGQGPQETSRFNVDGFGVCSAKILYERCGTGISSAQVSRLALNNKRLFPLDPTFRLIASAIENQPSP